jgi:tRNA A37 threonylcarbamoyladenosine dehydratase
MITTVCLDAIDHILSKKALMAACTDLQIPWVTCGGPAGRTDPTRFVVQNLILVQGDPLLSLCRKNLLKYHGFPSGVGGIKNRSTKNVARVPKQNEQNHHAIVMMTMAIEIKLLVVVIVIETLRRCNGNGML